MFSLSNIVILFILTVLMALLLSWIKFKSQNRSLFFICLVAAVWSLSFFWGGMIIVYLFNAFFLKIILTFIGFFTL